MPQLVTQIDRVSSTTQGKVISVCALATVLFFAEAQLELEHDPAH